MYSSHDQEWLDARIKQREADLKQESIKSRSPDIPVVDAGKFSQPLSDLAITLTHKVEREGPQTFSQSPVPIDKGMILRQLTCTYNLIRWVNADNTRYGNIGYHHPYSFVILPLVRTMIDGFYNCTALLDDPARSRAFRISGYFRIREALRADEERYLNDAQWSPGLANRRSDLQSGMRAEGFTDADLDERSNQWPLLGTYLRAEPDTPHKQLLRQLTLGFWREYSSISHVSFDALISLYPFIATDRVPHEKRDDVVDDVVLRYLAMHFGRAAGILLCLLTEIQHFYKFDGAEIDNRLSLLWAAMIPMYEVRELYESRYKGLLRAPIEDQTPQDTPPPPAEDHKDAAK